MSTHPTPDQIMQVGLGFWASKTLLSAIEMGLFTELADHPESLESLRERLVLHERSARDFLDALVALGFLERRDGVYANTPATDLFLDRRKPSYIGGILEMANHRLYGFWGSLTEALRTGRPQNEAKSGDVPLFDALYADPARLQAFLAAMTGISHGANLHDRGEVPVGRPVQLRRRRDRAGRPGRADGPRPPAPPGLGLRPARRRADLRGVRRAQRPGATALTFQPGDFFTDAASRGRRHHDGPHPPRLGPRPEAHADREGLRRRSPRAAP